MSSADSLYFIVVGMCVCVQIVKLMSDLEENLNAVSQE